MRVFYQLKDKKAVEPYKTHDDDFCYDVVATSREEIAPNVWKYGIGLGFAIDRASLPVEDVRLSLDFRPRSSIYKTGLILSNCIGTVDEGYRGEVSAIFYKVAEGKIYEVGDRILQCKIGFTEAIEWVEVDELPEGSRGEGGYGSTGR